MDAFPRLAEVSGAGASAVAEARALLADVPRSGAPLEAAIHAKRTLARHGFRDDAAAFTLGDMLARRGGNCLGLTLFVGAALIEAGHEVAFVVRRNPYDDVHAAGEEHFARLRDPETGVDEDSRLPDAADVTSRFRFVPVEHASLLLRSSAGSPTPFEPTTLAHDDSAWAPEAESVQAVSFAEITSTVWVERAKEMLRALPLRTTGSIDERRVLRRAARLVLRGLREWPTNREGWADLWRIARLLGRAFDGVAALAAERYGCCAQGADSLFAFTSFEMTGDAQLLDEALARFPSYAAAYFAKHTRGDRAAARRAIALVAWLVAESEVLDLERFYREHAAEITAAFSARELEELLATF